MFLIDNGLHSAAAGTAANRCGKGSAAAVLLASDKTDSSHHMHYVTALGAFFPQAPTASLCHCFVGLSPRRPVTALASANKTRLAKPGSSDVLDPPLSATPFPTFTSHNQLTKPQPLPTFHFSTFAQNFDTRELISQTKHQKLPSTTYQKIDRVSKEISP
jgi:hypothetical protein